MTDRESFDNYLSRINQLVIRLKKLNSDVNEFEEEKLFVMLDGLPEEYESLRMVQTPHAEIGLSATRNSGASVNRVNYKQSENLDCVINRSILCIHILEEQKNQKKFLLFPPRTVFLPNYLDRLVFDLSLVLFSCETP
jgi:hypothetical protein